MQLNIIQLPRTVPVQNERRPKENIPQTQRARELIRNQLRNFVNEQNPVAPLSLSELRELAEIFVSQHQLDVIYTDYVAVVLNSEVWRDHVAAVPYERRLLLLPKCLRIEDKCPAPFDEFGLLCKQCGLCSIQDLQEEAERLGYAVLVAEGSALVTAIIETGKIEAIIGVSCLSVLEKAFPYMEAAAIPGIAVPLLQDDCKDVTVDLEWIWEVIHLNSEDQTHRLNLDDLRNEVATWFQPTALDDIMGPATEVTEQIARAQLMQAGKRWRPFLTVCAWRALHGVQHPRLPEDLKKLAVAVECFHKASLIHDDIEDDDDLRYEQQTLHVAQGVPVALNTGDFLLGEGYRLIGECEAPPSIVTAMLRVAAAGHRDLCLGQGAELTWARDPQPLSSLQVLDIFRRKTSPAFEVALLVGAHYAECDPDTVVAIQRYSESLGIAYQIRDDLDDLSGGDGGDDISSMRPSLPLAMLLERVKAKAQHRAMVESVWQRCADHSEREAVRQLMAEYDVIQRCRVLQESYKEQAIQALNDLQNSSLKGLLRRVVSKIFVLEVEGWCHEFESRNAASGSAST